MKKRKKKQLWKKPLSFLLASAMFLSCGATLPAGGAQAEEDSGVISISSAQELAKIGKDKGYPMDADYELSQDIDLGEAGNWTPIGGAAGPEYALVKGDRVFSGTLDGRGHTITGLSIVYDGSKSGEKTNVSGLFAMIGSDSDKDYAEVKNINFSDVSIEHMLGGGDTAGTLCGDVNGFAKIDNIAVLSGTVTIKGENGGDLIGVGGIAGQTRQNMSAVQMSNLYNAASVTVEDTVSNTQERCGGIIGRIHQSGVIGSLSSCVNVGKVIFKGAEGYAINGCSLAGDASASANTANIKNCYYLEGCGKDMGASEAKTEEELASQEMADLLGSDFWMVENGVLMPTISQGAVLVPIPSPEFAAGDTASSVTGNFTVPLVFTSEEGEESLSWTSGDETVISIDGETGLATVHPVLSNTDVILTARANPSGRVKVVEVTVISSLKLSVDAEYAKPGEMMTASVEGAPEGTSFAYEWKVGKSEIPVSTSASYTPKQSDLNQFITVTATTDGKTVDTMNMYCSKLPVVYIDTEDGYGITSKTKYKKASLRIQGNDAFNSATTTLYDGAASIRGRGNSTWNTWFSKLPYKIKLDKKTDLFGFGKSKHWALLANYMDESLIRNTTSYDLSGRMGMTYLKSTHVELILNGTYAGNYQLVGNVRIEKERVNIHNWEDAAGDAAKAIAKAKAKEGVTIDQDGLEDHLNENMQWITSDTATYDGETYRISDYYELPKTEDGRTDVSGGFLFELDAYYDEISRFRTNSEQPIMFKNPEFASPVENGYEHCEALSRYAKQYIQAVEDSARAKDFYVDIQKQDITENASNFTEDFEGRHHYSELVDMDSLVNYLMLNEFYWNTETMKKSTFMYKDLGGKLFIGPVWDMDWTSNSRVSEAETSNYSVWMVNTAGDEAQKESWYRYLIRDPYFVEKLYECYHQNRQNFEDIVKENGIIDQDKEYLKESADANYNYGYLQHPFSFETETERLRTFLKNRLKWLDAQFKDYQTLLSSLGKYQPSNSISVSADTSEPGMTTYTASVTDNGVQKVGFYINGILAGTADVENGTAVLTAEDKKYLDPKEGAANIAQVRAMDVSGDISNYARFEKELPKELSGTVIISGTAVVGSVLTAEVSSNNTGEIFYQWLADNEPIAGAISATYQLTEREIGKQITVKVTSSSESESLISQPTTAVEANATPDPDPDPDPDPEPNPDPTPDPDPDPDPDPEPNPGPTPDPDPDPDPNPDPTPDPDPTPKPNQALVNSLKSLIQQAAGKKSSQYTKESYQKLLEAKTEAERAQKSGDSQKIQKAIEKLRQAINGLKAAEPPKKDDTNKDIPAKGKTFRYKNGWYEVTKSAASGGEALYVKPAKKTYKNAEVPAFAKINGIKFKVTRIKAKAFKNNKKLKKVTVGKYVTIIGASAFAGDKKLTEIKVKSSVLTEVGKQALKGVNAKCKIKVPKSRKRIYEKLFRKTGKKSSVKVVK